MSGRRGFALLAVLGMLAGISAVTLALAVATRGAIAATARRHELTRAEWYAEACLAVARLALDELTMTGGRDGRGPVPFDSLEARLHADARVRSCPGQVRLSPVGSRLDMNLIDGSVLRRILVGRRVQSGEADSMVAAFLDWRDPDDTPRPHGCERECSLQVSGARPRNGAFASTLELALVRGFAGASMASRPPAAWSTILTAEPGRVHLASAPFEVLEVLPGVGPEGASRLVALSRSERWAVDELAAIGAYLGPFGRDSLRVRFGELARLATARPDAWMLSITTWGDPGGAESRAAPIRLEARLSIGGQGTRLVQRRILP
ncbi:MAG: general secretion pathway protein GspK [Gemmatimonadales bacterium]|nr:general secretion pathway protein GspK [Gemmatimonadales bacterium]